MPPGRQELDIDARIRDALLRSIHYLGKRGFALLTGPLADLRYVTVGSARVGNVATRGRPSSSPILAWLHRIKLLGLLERTGADATCGVTCDMGGYA